MAADPKNIFNFGTGDIDKDQWLKDIDNGQEEFITTYGSATNKHRTALLRQAFQDLRSRLASGDMLRRNSDGMYEFSSALNRDDKHMQEAYERALGFMGNLARKQINTPKPEPEKKKFGATTLQDEYKKYLFPGEFNEKAYWDRDESKRKQGLIDFLNGYLKEGALDSYQDFGSFGSSDKLKERINAAVSALQSGQEMDWNLGRLGFQGNWISKPKDQEEEPEEPKSELEQAQEEYQAAIESQQAAQIRQQLASINTPAVKPSPLLKFTPKDLWQYEQFVNERNNIIQGLKYIDKDGKEFLRPGMIFKSEPVGNGKFKNSKSTGYTSWTGEWAKGAQDYAARQYNKKLVSDLTNYFSNLGVNYQSYLDKDKGTLMTNLAKLFTLNNEGNYMFNDTINQLFTKQEDGSYGLKGTALSYNPLGVLYKGTNTYKEGGILKGEDGLPLNGIYDISSNKQNKKQNLTTDNPSVQQFSNSENARIAATIADIASMGAAFVPGYGTAASAALGLGSTATNFGADLADGQGLWDATKNAGFGLAADVMGLIPGLGGVGKGAKIARNLMWAVPKMMQWVNTYQGLQNAGEIKNSITKLATPSKMGVQDWQNIQQALQIMTGHGRSIATKAKKAGMSKTTTTTEPEHYIFTNKGKQKVSDETFKKLREVKGTKARQTLTQELMGDGVILQQTHFAPWNTSTKFGAFKEVPGKTKIEVQNKHKGWFSDENLVEKAENFDSSTDIRGIINKINPYKSYYSRMSKKVKSKQEINPKQETDNQQPEPQNSRGLVWNEKTHSYIRTKQLGGTLKTLRNGGIIKASKGVKAGQNYEDWYGQIFNSYSDQILNGLLNSNNIEADVQWLNNMQTNHASIYNQAKNTDYFTNAWKPNDESVKNYQSEYIGGGGFTNGKPGGFNDYGITTNWNTRYGFGGTRTSGDKPNVFKTDNLFSAITDDRRLLGRLGDWTPENLNAFNEKIKEKGYKLDLDPTDNYYKLRPLTTTQPAVPTQPTIPEQPNVNNGGGTVVDTSGERQTITQTDFKNPFDPTHLITAGKLFQAIRGNANIYGNLLKEMPQAPLRDPIHRQLAIVGNQRVIDEARNKIGDLRQINRQQFGSDQQTNFATSLETERTGRDIYDKSLDQDAARQFDTAQKLWNLKNEDTFYNTKVGDDNRKSIADRARMMAQIRAAWRSGDQNAIMGALADEGNWFMKKYQTEQDLVNKAKELQLGTIEQRAQSELEQDPTYKQYMDKYTSGQTLTDEERAYIRKAQADVLKKIRGTYSQDYYNMYHNPIFGGGYRTSLFDKDGGKLEIEKLKARSKDNDRYVSMIKDLRKTSYRRRRR